MYEKISVMAKHLLFTFFDLFIFGGGGFLLIRKSGCAGLGLAILLFCVFPMYASFMEFALTNLPSEFLLRSSFSWRHRCCRALVCSSGVCGRISIPQIAICRRLCPIWEIFSPLSSTPPFLPALLRSQKISSNGGNKARGDPTAISAAQNGSFSGRS